MRLHKTASGCMKLVCLGCCILLFSGCSSGEGPGQKVVAQINSYRMTTEDLKYEFKNAPYDQAGLLKTEDGRKKYLDAIIEKEVLLQEAQRQGIDREKGFMKSIENYWEQALLKILLERKSKEISSMIHVYDNEIEAYYKDSGEGLPLPKVRNEIMDVLKQKKETEVMNLWVEELKKRSYIKVDEKILKDEFSNTR